MVTDPTARTLYDDWKARRERLAHASGGAAGHAAVEMRLLDYLLRRYRASPEAARPARFALPATVFVNHRAIIVHHHLRQGPIPPITNEQEALAHVRPIAQRIHRMQSLSASGEIVISDAGVADCAIPPPADPAEAERTKLCDSDPWSESRLPFNSARLATWTISAFSQTCFLCRLALASIHGNENRSFMPCNASREQSKSSST